MKVLLTENSSIGMLHLSSMEPFQEQIVITDFHSLGRYNDPLLDIEDFIKLCNTATYTDAICIVNKSPWSDMIWSKETQDSETQTTCADVHRIKLALYDICGWQPDAVINIYDKKPSSIWRARLAMLTESDPNITIVSLNADDPKFAKNIVDAVRMCAENYGNGIRQEDEDRT